MKSNPSTHDPAGLFPADPQTRPAGHPPQVRNISIRWKMRANRLPRRARVQTGQRDSQKSGSLRNIRNVFRRPPAATIPPARRSGRWSAAPGAAAPPGSAPSRRDREEIKDIHELPRVEVEIQVGVHLAESTWILPSALAIEGRRVDHPDGM